MSRFLKNSSVILKIKDYYLFFLLTLIIILSGIIIPLTADDWGSADDWGTWDEKEIVEISGYLETTALTVIPRRSDSHSLRTGFQNLLRLRLFCDPSSNISVTVEGDYLDRRGVANPSVRAELSGLPVGTEERSLVQGSQGSGFMFDYVYGSFRAGLLDLRVGRQPIAWGTAYAFNPTDLANPSLLSELAGIEPPGFLAIAPSVTVGQNWALEGYFGFEDRDRSSVSATDLTSISDHPLGLRVRGFLDSWDLGLGYVRSLEFHQGLNREEISLISQNAILEFAGSIGAFNVYGEMAISLESEERFTEKSINSAVGFQYFLFEDYSLHVEYHRRGRGKNNFLRYDSALRLRGGLAARDYLVTVLDFMTMNDDLRVTISSLSNLNDQSMVLFPAINYTVIQNLEFEIGGSWFLGREKTEFDGRFEIKPEENHDTIEIDIGRPQLYLTSTWYF